MSTTTAGPINSNGIVLDLTNFNGYAFAPNNFAPVVGFRTVPSEVARGYYSPGLAYPAVTWGTENTQGLSWLNGSTYTVSGVFEAQQVVEFTVTHTDNSMTNFYGLVLGWNVNNILFAGYLNFDPTTGVLSNPMSDSTTSYYAPTSFPDHNIFGVSSQDLTAYKYAIAGTSFSAYTYPKPPNAPPYFGVPFGLTSSVPCFTFGTRIMTPHGEVAVEHLREGDEVLTASGAAKRIIWIGKRLVDCGRYPKPENVWPVRIAANAFEVAVPKRDLFLSPDHTVYAEGVLIPARELINGTTVVQVQSKFAFYFHVELETHDVVLAEGLPAETYLDTGNRRQIEDGRVVQLNPGFALGRDSALLVWEARGYAPLTVVGPEVERVRAQLAARAEVLAAAQDQQAA